MAEKKVYQEIPAGRNNFHSAILTTYSFNFQYFEYQVLKTLKRKSIYNIGVLVDDNMLDRGLGISSTGLKQLTQTYSINGIHSLGAFHPKINFLIGDNQLLLVLGSGNITAGGHGKNHETFTTLYADNIDSPLIPILNEGWAYLQKISNKLEGYSSNRIEKVIPKNCELIKNPPEILHQYHKIDDDLELALLYKDKISIFNQLLSLIPQNGIKAITIVSPYYDEDGNFLINLLNKFPSAIINVYLPSEQGLPPINIIPNSQINFYKWENTKRGKKEVSASEEYKRKLHSKLFFFHSEDYEYCLLGSANATTAAFGTLKKSGINEEFGILYKSRSTNFLSEFGITGKKVKANLKELLRDTLISRNEQVSLRRKKLIKIGSCDLIGLTIKCYCSFTNDLENIFLCVFDDVGNAVQRKTIVSLASNISLHLDSSSFKKNPAYVLFEDKNNNVISNKQVINNVDQLYNTDPSKENRAIRSLRSALEMGQIDEYKLLGYLNELNRRESKPKSTISSSQIESKEEKEAIHGEMTFEEAMEASRNKNHNKLLSSKHNTIQLWQTITSLLKENQIMALDDLNDEEEEADASQSNERKTTELNQGVYEIKDGSEFRAILKKTEQLCNSFVLSANKLSRSKDYEINEVLLCQFLLISHIITVIHQFNSYELPYNHKENEYKVYNPNQWRNILRDKYYTLMQDIIIAFSKIIMSRSIIQIEDDDYRSNKCNNYIQEVVSYIFIYHYFINKNGVSNPHSELTDLACINILSKFGKPNENFIDRLELLSKSKTEELFNTQQVIRLKTRIENLFDQIDKKETFFKHRYLDYGICFVKQIDAKKVKFKSIYDIHQIFSMDKKEWNKL